MSGVILSMATLKVALPGTSWLSTSDLDGNKRQTTEGDGLSYAGMTWIESRRSPWDGCQMKDRESIEIYVILHAQADRARASCS